MTTSHPLAGAPLVLVDLQRAIDHPDWGVRNNPDAEKNLAQLLELWRAKAWPVIHVKHDSNSPTSHYRPGQRGHDFKPEVMPIDGEIIISKTTNSAFVEPDLRDTLSVIGQSKLYLAGVKTNNSIETTVRHGGNLGYDIHLIADGCFTHDQVDWNGKTWSAADVHAMALSNLDGEYCTVTTTAEILAALTRTK